MLTRKAECPVYIREGGKGPVKKLNFLPVVVEESLGRSPMIPDPPSTRSVLANAEGNPKGNTHRARHGAPQTCALSGLSG